jgi:hypothetical protein
MVVSILFPAPQNISVSQTKLYTNKANIYASSASIKTNMIALSNAQSPPALGRSKDLPLKTIKNDTSIPSTRSSLAEMVRKVALAPRNHTFVTSQVANVGPDIIMGFLEKTT